MAATGLEMLIRSLVKAMGLDPALVQTNIEQIGQGVHTVAANSEIIRRQNSAIMAHLGIAEPEDDVQPARTIEHAAR